MTLNQETLEGIRDRARRALDRGNPETQLTRAERDRQLLIDHLDDLALQRFREMSANDSRIMWVVYARNGDPYPMSLHSSAEQACRDAARQGHGLVAAWPETMEFFEAINTWEAMP